MTNYDILEALNDVDDACVKSAKAAAAPTPEKRRISRLKRSTIAACFCLTLAVSVMAVYQTQNRADPNGPGIPPATDSIPGSQFTVEYGIYVGGKLYMPDAALSENATKENMGAVVGYVSFDNKTTLDICACEYLPNDGKTNRVIVSVNDSFYVYSFYLYIPEDNDSWPMDLLHKAARVEIRDVNFGASDETVYAVITDPDAIVAFLSCLDNPRTRNELTQYCFDKFKNQFRDGEIWIAENGGIACDENSGAGNRYRRLVDGDDRIILVVMADNTCLRYRYFEGAGVITLEDSGCGYILTEEQIETFNSLIGLA